ncbi:MULTISPECIES: hypothetical protein [Fusobacterium]|uniref:hypothetical protein n=1 Tax=Fusobacterium TaxID=848 RepID=UPI00023269F3|nr:MULTISPECIES: hypothetical protein [Fusobacterium]PCR86046.1 hypothetical protein CQA79_01490 [Fusobacterium nucleatum]QJX49849.1 hypothetical protein HOO60_02805 [Fusobacterium nucleatum]
MKILTYKNLNMGETIINFLILLFQQAIFFGFIFIYVYLDYTVYIQKDYKDAGTIILVIHNIVCLIINFFYLRAVKNAIFNFFTYEEYKVNEGKLYYEKKLKLYKKNFCLRKFEIDLTYIDSINLLSEKKLIHYRRRKAGLQRYIEYFTPYERIKIKLIDGKEYSVCNYVKKPEYNETYNEAAESVFQTIANNIKDFILEEKENYKFQKELVNLEEKYNLPLEERYNFILNKIIDEEILFVARKDGNYIINGIYNAIEYLEIFKTIYFEEVDFYLFYVNLLSKKENQDKKVLVGFNGIDGKEVTISELKDDINEIRDSKSTFI